MILDIRVETSATLTKVLFNHCPPQTIDRGPVLHESLNAIAKRPAIPQRQPASNGTGLDGVWLLELPNDHPEELHLN